MASDTGDHVGNSLMSFKQYVGVQDELVTNNHQNISGSGTKWDQTCHEKDILHIFTEPYSHWQNAADELWRYMLQLYEKNVFRRVCQKN